MFNASNAGTSGGARYIQEILQVVSKGVLIAVTAAAVLWLAASAVGLVPWMGLMVSFGEGEAVNAGPFVQMALALFLIGICAFLPSVNRMNALERSHRRFHVGMKDVARAYWACHEADRTGTFKMTSEFDSVRERVEFMKHHPDLEMLEPEILELAAQMSQTSRDLATVYSEEKVERARAFLRAREQELDSMEHNISLAIQVSDSIKRWHRDIEAGEKRADRQLERLEADLREVLPELGFTAPEKRPVKKAERAKVLTMPANGEKTSERPN